MKFVYDKVGAEKGMVVEKGPNPGRGQRYIDDTSD